jgi:hypothetical protein
LKFSSPLFLLRLSNARLAEKGYRVTEQGICAKGGTDVIRNKKNQLAKLHPASDAAHALPAEDRLYDNLFLKEDPEGQDFTASLNPDSLEVIAGLQDRTECARRGAGN